MEMKMFKKSILCAVAALSIAATAGSPANALSSNGALALGLGAGTAAAIGVASTQQPYQLVDHRGYRHRDSGGVYFGIGPGFGLYTDDGYYSGGGYGYGGYGYRRENRGYRYWARECADRFGWETRRWNRCMDRHGF